MMTPYEDSKALQGPENGRSLHLRKRAQLAQQEKKRKVYAFQRS